LTVKRCKKRSQGRTYDFLAIDPALRISYQLIGPLLLLLALFHSSLQDPAQSFRNHNLSLINDAVSSASGFVTFGGAATVPRSAVSGRVLGDRRWGHYLAVKGEPLHSWENCCGHLDSSIQESNFEVWKLVIWKRWSLVILGKVLRDVGKTSWRV
jgi:hypothetical protein